MSIQQSTEVIIFVTHVEAEDTFLKIWGQVDKNSATCVERMILPLVEQFAQNQGCVGPQSANLRVNALCCARFQNEGYYRARVLSIRADGMVVLQFIDYGNVEVLPPQEIHLLENIHGSESLQSCPPVAFDFTLMHVLPVNGAWDDKIVESIKKTLWYNEYKILIHTVVNNHRFIKLWYNNEDFSELLIKRHMAVGASLQEMFRPKCIQQPQVPMYQQSSKHLINNSCAPVAPMQGLNPLHCDGNDIHGYQRNVPLCCAAQQKHTMQTPVQEALVFKSRVLDVPSKHDVYVSFVEDGPHKFSVQLQSTSQILSMLMRDINSHPIEPLQEPPLPGSVCLGRYTQDKVLCRAVVMSVMENKCKLYYVDFGHTEVLPYTDIFQLPPHFINPKVLSIRFTLSGVHELKVTDEMKEYFKQIVSGKLLVLHVRPPEGPPLVQYGDLYDNGKNIKNILRQAFPTPSTMTPPASTFGYQEAQKLLKGTEEIVYVSFVESCKKFFVQLESGVKPLESIMNCLTEFCKTAPTLSLTQLRIGLPCAALYDNQWYRAQILSINTDNAKVLYVDYGNEETVTLASLRLIHDDLVTKLQAQAIKCILNGWELLPSTQEVSTQFELLILEKHLRLRVVDVNPDGIVVDLYEPERMESIKSQILNIVGDDHEFKSESNYQNMENQHITKISSKINQSENTNKWHKRDQVDSWNETQISDTIPERNKPKNWRDESNEGKVHESRNEKNSFHRMDPRNERFTRDEFPNNRNTRDKWNNKNESNDSFKSGRGAVRGSRNRTSGFVPKAHSSDKSWSDKDSDTSSKGSGRRGKGGGTRGYSRRDGFSGRNQSSRTSDKDSDGSFRGGKMSNDSYHGSNKLKDRKGQGHRLSQNKFNASHSGEETQRYSPMRNRNDFQIPSPNVAVGTTKTCEIVFTNSPSDFFIQLSPDYTALDSVMESIASVYENGGELMKDFRIRNGVYCIAQYSEDWKWYRAVIKSVEGNSATVQFVDYGNTETVEFDKIKNIQKEFLTLPIQAVHCKLFGLKDVISDQSETKLFEDKVNGKTFEAEFITEENGVYSVLLREVIEGCPASAFINEEFCEGIDLLKAKEDALSYRKTATNTKQSAEPDYADLNTKWATISYIPGTKKDVIITWFTNPNNFYCQTLDNENEFRTMMNDIQKTYVGREPIRNTLQIGSSVIAIFSDDGALYRAEVIELNKFNGHLIQYIDFGNSAVVDPLKIYPVEKKFMELPKQAVQCSLLNIVPQDGLSWSKVNTGAIDSCFNADKYECIFHDMQDNKYLISLSNKGNDIANMLVEKNLASLIPTSKSDDLTEDGTTPITISYDVERLDINLLSGQALRVKVSSVENTSKFYVQLPSAIECENMINTYMADKDPKVMQRLSAHEICLGTGCLVYSNGIWRRAVITSHSQSKGFDVKFIDTGAYDEILSDSVLALPGELSVMQNQAVECSLKNVASSPEADAILKERVEGKEVIMYVDEVDNNSLIVKLFDSSGNKINITEDDGENILPICPMPILNSTYKVLVSYADHSASVWLQRNIDYELNQSLSEALHQYYTTSGKLVEPKVDLLCAAKSIDDHWYRAKVIKCTETGVYVNFIDYGNNEEVTHDVVMALDPCFYQPYQLAINVSLPVTLNCTIDEQLNILQSYLLNKDLTAVFRNINNEWIAELLCDGEKISDKFRLLNSASQQGTSEKGQPQIHDMAVGCKYDVYVSHVDSPSQFWLQRVDDAADLSKKQEELQTQASQFPQIDGIPEEGSLCVAVYTIDNSWYRAQVLDADEDITTVRFIDYGNTDVIDNKSGNIRQILDSWKEIKEYAVKCRLDIIPVDSEDWNAATCEKFENLIASVESLQALVIANGIPKRVDLLINNKSVSETLVEDHHAVIVHAEEDLIDEIVDLELDPHSAFVSHINSPSEFWVQEEKSVGDLEVMSDRFIVADMFPKVDEIKENMLCVAKYPEDECWYRARVISHSDNATRVIYIDYGNSATSIEIRAIPEDLATIPPLSRKCRLAMPEGITEWSEKACAEFTKLAADGATIFLLDVLKDEETSLVTLTLDGKNVADLLASLCERYSPIIEERLPPLGEENSPNVFICRGNSPDEFWIQTESSTADLNMMLERLKAAPSFLPLNTFEANTICAAKFLDDGEWYRAKILSHSEDGTEVQYIDYGNIAITNDVRILPADINIPALSKHCTLQKPDTVNSWSLQACKKFEELSGEGLTMFQLEILDDSSDPISVKLSLNGKNVVDILASYSESASLDADIVEREAGLREAENIHETFADHEENKNYNNLKENVIVKTKEDEINCDVEEDMSEPIARSEETLQTYDQQNDDASETPQRLEEQEKQDQVASQDTKNSVVELTVDEIVQNMKKDATNELEEEEKTFESTTSNAETYENKDSENVIKNSEKLETQDEMQSNANENVTTDAIKQQTSIPIDVENSAENLEEVESNVIDSDLQVDNNEAETCELNASIKSCKNDNKIDTAEIETYSNLKKDAINESEDEEKTFGSTTSNAESYENKDTENVTKDLEKLETQDEMQSNANENVITDAMNEQASISIDVKNSAENLEKVESNVIDSDLQVDNNEAEECELNESIESCKDGNKLGTADVEIYSTLKKDATNESENEEKTFGSATSNAESYENKDTENVTKDLKKLKTQDKMQSNANENVTTDAIKQQASTPIDVENSAENLEEVESNVIDSDLQVDNNEAETCELNASIEFCKDDNKLDTAEVETYSTLEKDATNEPKEEEKTFESATSNAESSENKDTEIVTKDLEKLETQSNANENVTTDAIKQHASIPIYVENSAGNLEEVESNVIDSDLQIDNNEAETCELNASIETSKDDNKLDTAEVETYSTLEKDATNEPKEEEKTFESATSNAESYENKDTEIVIKDLGKLETQDELQSNAKKNVTTDIINEQVSILTNVENSAENREKVKSNVIDSELQVDNNGAETCELSAIIESCKNDNKIDPAEIETYSHEQSVEARLDESMQNSSSTDVLKEESIAAGTSKEDNTECKIHDDDKVTISIKDHKNDSEIKNIEECEPSDVQSVEIINECKATDKQDTTPTTNTTVSMDVNEINSNKDSLQSESVSKSSE